MVGTPCTTLVILRHAETEWNRCGRLQGRTDIPLSAAGRDQALRWRLPAGARSFRWVVSPLERARETARQMGLSAVAEPRLAEMAWGDWEGRYLAELRETGLMTAELEALGLDFRAPHGESPRDVQERLRPWLKEIGGLRRPVGAVAHNGVLRALYALASGWDMKAEPAERLRPNCAHQFRIGMDGTAVVQNLNIPL